MPLKDPRQQSRLGRLADRDVELAHAREWSRNRLATARQLADEIENIKNSRRADVAGVSEWDGSPGRSKGDLLRERLEKGLITAPAAGLASMGVGAVGPAMLAAPSSLGGKAALGAVSGALSGIGGEDPSFGALAGVVPAIGVAQLVNSMYRDEPLVPMSEAKAGDWRRLFSGLSTPNKLNRPFYATTDPAYASKRAMQKSKSDDPMFVHMPKVDDDRLIQFGKTYNTLSAPGAFRNFPRGDSVTGEDIYSALKPLADEHSDYLVKSMGYAGHERPNTGDFGNGQWFRIADPDAVTQKFAGGGLALLRKALTGQLARDAGTTHVIKNKGGNWLSGSVEGALSGLKKFPQQYAPEEWVKAEDVLRRSANGEISGVDPAAATRNLNDFLGKRALDSFIDKQLTRYVKNDMATPEDPIRALAERGVLHIEPNMTRLQDLSKLRESLGFSAQPPSESTAAQYWNNLADASVFPRRSGELLSKAAEPSAGPLRERISSDRHWMQNVPKDTLINTWRGNQRDLGFSHLTDELANALNPESGLPRHLLLDPKSMDRVSVPQAVERVAAINAWRAAQKAEADMLRANNAATVLHKDYPDKGFKWVELKSPEARLGGGYSTRQQYTRSDGSGPWEVIDQEGRQLSVGETEKEALGLLNRKEREAQLQDALKYEGDTMGHCVGGYCDDVASGRTKIYSLRDAKGQPHVTVEVNPSKKLSENDLPDDVRGMLAETYGDASREEFEAAVARAVQERQTGDRIVQIKGKANAKPNDEYLPFVQDFVKSGKWSDVGDLRNAGLGRVGDRYLTPDEIRKIHSDVADPNWIEANNFLQSQIDDYAQGGTVDKDNLSVKQLRDIIAQIRQEHINAA